LSALVIYELTENEEYSDFLLEVLKNGESIADNIIIAAYYLYFYDFKNSSRLFDQIFSDLDEDVKNKFQKKYGSGKEGRS
ncbi:MAG: hypothetical protein KAI72_07740, partial [Candidatus Pacebacteria bacterium]|nr:hypothetical protein [Candidatus Paceibacterota bacterium]